MTRSNRIGRRRFLKAVGGVGVGLSVAGCVDASPFGSGRASDDVVLDPPDGYDRLVEADLPHPIHGEPLPEAAMPAPLHDREVTTTEFVSERHVILTFVFTRCSMACPLLVGNLVQVQAVSISGGFTDEFALLPVTFDVEHDTEAVIDAYERDLGVARDAGNWWFLRPASPTRARQVVTETFGVAFEYLEEDERQMANMAWLHSNLILLANADGYVERAYTGDPPNPARLLDDVALLRERW